MNKAKEIELNVIPMGRGEAQSTLQKAKNSLSDFALSILALHDREGWIALGFDSWTHFTTVEFPGYSQPYLSQTLAAGRVKRNLLQVPENQRGDIAIAISNAPESQMRPLAKLKPEQQREAWKLATSVNPKPTADFVAKVAKTIERAVSDAKRDEEYKSRIIEPSPEDEDQDGSEPAPEWCENWLTLSAAINRIVEMPQFNARATAEYAVFQNSNAEKARKAVSVLQSYIKEIEKLCTQ